MIVMNLTLSLQALKNGNFTEYCTKKIIIHLMKSIHLVYELDVYYWPLGNCEKILTTGGRRFPTI